MSPDDGDSSVALSTMGGHEQVWGKQMGASRSGGRPGGLYARLRAHSHPLAWAQGCPASVCSSKSSPANSMRRLSAGGPGRFMSLTQRSDFPQGTWPHAEQVDVKDSEGNRSPSTGHTVGVHSMPAPPSFYALSGVFLWVTMSELGMLEINCSKISPQDD